MQNRFISILHLEDNPADAELVKIQLEKHFDLAQYKHVKSIKAFKKQLSKSCYSVIISDYHMPDGSGMDALKIAKERGKSDVFILVSGAIGQELAVEAQRQGATDFVMKNNLAKLPLALERAVEEQKKRWEKIQAELDRDLFLKELQASERLNNASNLASDMSELLRIALEGYGQIIGELAGRLYRINHQEKKLDLELDLSDKKKLKTLEKKLGVNSRLFVPDIINGVHFKKVIDSGEIFVTSEKPIISEIMKEHTKSKFLRNSVPGIIKLYGIKSMAIIPLTINSKVEGLFLVSSIIDKIDAEKIKRLQRFSEQIKVVLTKTITEKQVRNSLIMGQEMERNRIAMGLHDGMGQLLTALQLNINLLSMNPAGRKAILSKVIDLADKSIKEYRAISHNLISPRIYEEDIDIIITKLIEETFAHWPVRLRSSIKLKSVDISDVVKLELYRISQEILQNSIKHSQASELKFNVIQNESDVIEIVYQDNGIGFDKTQHKKGVGLVSLENRIRALNGTLDIHSKIEEGTRIKMAIPLRD